MEINMSVFGKIRILMDLENITIQMEIDMKDNIRMI